jgi:pyruvate/2-oxoglutarate dehydrogenase complex dihydrolipoamide dehydrogenase (E3) component
MTLGSTTGHVIRPVRSGSDARRTKPRSETSGFIKTHLDAETRQLLGVALLGIEGDEIVQGLLEL